MAFSNIRDHIPFFIIMRKFIFVISIISILKSCVIVGLSSDYEKLEAIQKELIFKLENFNKAEVGKIYKINPSQLKEEIGKYPKSLVYVFTNGCSSPDCLPLNSYVNFAGNNGYKLFLVMNGYGELEKTLNQHIESPLFSIDNEYYKMKYRNVYTRYFTNELLGKPKKTKISEREQRGNLYFFNYGKSVYILRKLPEE